MTLLIHDVPVECINQAATTYHVPVTVIISVLRAEGGKNGLASKNKDGSYDYGPMQINSRWLEKIAPYGYTTQDLQYRPCVTVAIGTWILSLSIAEGKNIWTGIGNYHSHTSKLNQKYSSKIKTFRDWINGIINTK
jgi:hypothetical protein